MGSRESTAKEKQVVKKEPVVEKRSVEEKEPVVKKQPVVEKQPAVENQPLRNQRPHEEYESCESDEECSSSSWTKGTLERASNDPTVRVIVAGDSWATEPGHLVNQFKGIGYVPEPPCGYEGGFKRKCTISHVQIDGETVVLQVWDGTLEERDRSIKLLQKDYVGLLLLYDVRDEHSFDRVKEYVTVDMCKQVDPELPVVMVGCQWQPEQMREVPYHVAREFADEKGYPVVEVCGREGVNVDMAFMTLVGEVLSKHPFGHHHHSDDVPSVKIIVAMSSLTTEPWHLINTFNSTHLFKDKDESQGARVGVALDGDRPDLDIWYRSLEEYDRYTLMLPIFKRFHVGFMMLYDVRDEVTFQRVKEHITVHMPGYLDLPIVLVGCQCQQKERREVTYHAAREFADGRGIPVVEVCAEEEVNVELAFMTLVGEIFFKNPISQQPHGH